MQRKQIIREQAWNKKAQGKIGVSYLLKQGCRSSPRFESGSSPQSTVRLCQSLGGVATCDATIPVASLREVQKQVKT